DTIYIVRTGQQIVVGADSGASKIEHGKPAGTKLVCKFRQVKGTLLFVTGSGQIELPDLGLNALDKAAEACLEPGELPPKVQTFEKTIIEPYQRYLQWCYNEPTCRDYYEHNKKNLLDIAFFGSENGTMKFYRVHLNASDSGGRVSVISSLPDVCPGPSCTHPEKAFTLALGDFDAITEYQRDHNALREQADIGYATRFLIQRQIDAEKELAATEHRDPNEQEPINILVIDSSAARWFQGGGLCPEIIAYRGAALPTPSGPTE